MDAVAVLVAAFDDACGHPWESLASAVADLDAATAAWRPPGYQAEPHDVGIGVPGTVLWHLNHLEHCHRHYAAVLRARPVATLPDTPPPGELPLPDVLAALERADAALRAEIAALAPADLDAPCAGRTDVRTFVTNLTRHVAWHAAQVRQTRRLATA